MHEIPISFHPVLPNIDKSFGVWKKDTDSILNQSHSCLGPVWKFRKLRDAFSYMDKDKKNTFWGARQEIHDI